MAYKLLYIGDQADFITSFEGDENLQFVHCTNSLSFNNYLEAQRQPPHLDMVLCELELRGMDGYELYQYFKDFFISNNIPFALRYSSFNNYRKRTYLKSGITEIYDSSISKDVIVERIPFLQNIEKIKKEKLKKIAYQEYKIPLVKRVFDITVASLALLALAPLLIIVIIAIKLESKGPFWYKSKRVGTGYKIFDFYKLRSMYVDADQRLKDLKHLNQYAIEAEAQNKKAPVVEKLSSTSTYLIHKDGTPLSEDEFFELKKAQTSGTFIKIKNDPRITKVGNFIRNTSIDELPQLINVLKGDMSIVGNRPLPLYEAEQLTSDDWGERFLAPAGITGLWQVEKRGKGDMSEEERKALDNRYARNFSVMNDIKLILKTIPALFQKENV